VIDRKMKGWAITRIPPLAAPTPWGCVRTPVSLISLSRVVLQEDLVECSRMDTGEDWLLAFKV